MSPAKRAAREATRRATARAVAILNERGICWQDWARKRGFSPAAVKDVCRDRNPATRGEAFRVATVIRNDADRVLERELVSAGDRQACVLGMALSACESALASARERIVLSPNPAGFDLDRIDHALDLARLALRGGEAAR